MLDIKYELSNGLRIYFNYRKNFFLKKPSLKFILKKKHIKLAVDRNYIKRIFRSFSVNLNTFPLYSLTILSTKKLKVSKKTFKFLVLEFFIYIKSLKIKEKNDKNF